MFSAALFDNYILLMYVLALFGIRYFNYFSVDESNRSDRNKVMMARRTSNGISLRSHDMFFHVLLADDMNVGVLARPGRDVVCDARRAGSLLAFACWSSGVRCRVGGCKESRDLLLRWRCGKLCTEIWTAHKIGWWVNLAPHLSRLRITNPKLFKPCFLSCRVRCTIEISGMTTVLTVMVAINALQ